METKTPLDLLNDKAFSVFNSRDQAEEEKKEQRDSRLLAAILTRPNPPPGHPKSTPRRPLPRKGACFSRGTPKHWNKESPGNRAQSTHKTPCPLCKKMGHWRRECPQLWRERGSSPTPVMAVVDWLDPGPPKSPKKIVIITQEEPRVTTGRSACPVFSGYGSHLLCPNFSSWAPCPRNLLYCWGRRRPKLKHFTTPLICTGGKTLITHKFLVMPEFPRPLLGRDFLSALEATLTLPENQNQGIFLAGLCIIQDSLPSPK